MVNVIRWLLGEEGSATSTWALTPRIVTAHLPENQWCVMKDLKSTMTCYGLIGRRNPCPCLCYRHQQDVATTNWLTSHFPGATVSAINTCDNFALPECLLDADFLIVGSQMGKDSDAAANSNITDATAVTDAVELFARHGKPVMYVHFSSDPTQLAFSLFSRVLGLSQRWGDNYWEHTRLENVTSAVTDALRSETILAGLQRATRCTFDLTNTTGINLEVEDYISCYRGGGQSWSVECNQEPFNSKIRQPLLTVRDTLRQLDESGRDLFPQDASDAYQPEYLKIAVLLGDKARERIFFPFNRTDRFALATTMYGDATVLYRRRFAPAQSNVGTLTCPESYIHFSPQPATCIALGLGKGGSRTDGISMHRKVTSEPMHDPRPTPRSSDQRIPLCTDYRNYSSTEPRYNDVTINQPTLIVNTWTTTGLFAMPGDPITVRRTDNNSAAVSAYVRFWFQREATTKAFNWDYAPRTNYDRPQFVQSQRILLPADGNPIVLSAPYGGPIYLQMENRLPNDGANDGAYNVTAVFDNVAKHPAILDMSNDTQVAHFANTVLTSRLPSIDMRADGIDIHARKDKFTNALRVTGMCVIQWGGEGGVPLQCLAARVSAVPHR